MVGRISAENRASYEVIVNNDVCEGVVRGRFYNKEKQSFPKVGDYVEVTIIEAGKVTIENILPRKNKIVRKAPHTGEDQVMVVNIDYLCIVMGLDADYNLHRLQRYIALARQSEVSPVIILNKQDVAINLKEQVAAVTSIAADIPVHTISAMSGEGVSQLDEYLCAGNTVVLLGSSGAGKSTLTNTLLQNTEQSTQTLREHDGRGRHTTTSRQLFELPSGALLIDTPGMRELALLDEDISAADAYTDIATLATQCRFTNCDHIKSAGCALQTALEEGNISATQLNGYLKLQQNAQRTRRIRGR